MAPFSLLNQKRNITIDGLRGIALVIMAIDHLPHNFLGALFNIYGPIGFFSANTCFLFLSGIVSGFTYGAVVRERGTLAVREKAWRRAGEIYFVQMALFLAVAAAGYSSKAFQSQHVYFYHHPWYATARGAVFLYQFQFLDILPLYCIFLLLTPLAIKQFQRRKTWTILVPSLLFWGAAQLGIPPMPLSGDGQLFFLNPFACQVVFFVGVYFGCRYQRDTSLTKPFYHSRVMVAVCALAGAAFFVLRMIAAFSQSLDPWLARFAGTLSIQTQGVLRLLNFAIWAYLIWRFQRPLQAVLHRNQIGGWLAFVGQHSLQVFAWTVLFAGCCRILMPSHVSRPFGRIETLLSVATLVLPAWIHLQYRQMLERRRAGGSRLEVANLPPARLRASG